MSWMTKGRGLSPVPLSRFGVATLPVPPQPFQGDTGESCHVILVVFGAGSFAGPAPTHRPGRNKVSSHRPSQVLPRRSPTATTSLGNGDVTEDGCRGWPRRHGVGRG